MKLAYFDYTLDISVRVYIENVTRNLERLGVELLPFDSRAAPPREAHLYWDPRLTGGTPPWWRLRATGKPVVATLHDGVPQLSVAPWEYYRDLRSAGRGLYGVAKRFVAWRHWRGRCAALIAVSKYAREEARRNLRLRAENIVPIYHGIDHELFRPGSGETAPYFLHVSAYQPKKNFRRILTAYAALPAADKPCLRAVVPGYPTAAPSDGVEITREALPQSELVPLYQNALGFLFPSLHESFGMPIVEAMACGCPVVTSDRGACAEVAGDAAILVNPHSVGDLRRAMWSLMADGGLRDRLREQGLRRARSFTWQQCAESHFRVFAEALRDRDEA
jgi:glycosyltransferase involved in cell wall biosynthesis